MSTTFPLRADATGRAGRRQEGGIRTAAAIHNLEEEPVEVSCRFMSGGAVIEEVKIPLEGNGQTSWLIDQAFPAVDTFDFVGSVRCDALGASSWPWKWTPAPAPSSPCRTELRMGWRFFGCRPGA